MQFGREPALGAAQSLVWHLTPDSANPASAGGVLMRPNRGGIHDVQVPIDLASGIGRSSQS